MGVRNRIVALVAVILAIALGLILWGTVLTYAGRGETPFTTGQESVDPKQGQPLDLEKASQQAENLTEDVYNGLDTTKQVIGKTEGRNEAIEAGRATASNNLRKLAERAEQAENSPNTSLSETDKRVLKHLSE
ncbi:hypothetical protein [Leptolyngbya sp. KIOST-1]|uniref:hypothetical protein n=1 Tax=Leptolyngbya sp. KIOST-1 TaxID=1229172 RepID=UPI00055AE306|nr:hypothetical protein [Leptolyngbya sp. KIOST-1]